MARTWFERLTVLWVFWLRIEYRALAVLLPVICFELAVADTVLAHLPVYLGLLGALPVLLFHDAWRLAAQIRPAA